MKFVIQRVTDAKVMIADQCKSAINAGLLIYMAIHQDDEMSMCEYWINKILKLRIFPDDQKPINRSIMDIDGETLLPAAMKYAGPLNLDESDEKIIHLDESEAPSSSPGCCY